jgi:hypothetical protein
MNKIRYKAQPVPPIYQPEVPARTIYFAATHKRRDVWAGFPTVKAILANHVDPRPDRPLPDQGRRFGGNSPTRRSQPTSQPTCSSRCLAPTTPTGGSTIKSVRNAGKCSPTGTALLFFAAAGAADIALLHQVVKKPDV